MTRRNYLRTANLLFNQALMVTPEMLDLGVRWANQAMQLNIVNVGPAGERMFHDDDGPAPDPGEQPHAATGVAVVPVHGILVSRSTQLDFCETMTSYEQIRMDLRAALNDPSVYRIALDIDSYGGHATGAFELADEIRQMRLQKPITAIVNHNAYSAAYLIASSCTEVVVSKSGGVGSIGVIASHLDRSQLNEKMGITITTVYAGAHKNDGTPHAPLTDQALAAMQAGVNEAYAMFTEAVAAGRNLSAQAVIDTQAATYRGEKGLALGLVDRIATAQDALDGLVADVRASRAPSQSIALRAKAADLQAQI